MVRFLKQIRQFILFVNHKIALRRIDWVASCILRTVKLLEWLVKYNNQSKEINEVLLEQAVHFSVIKFCELENDKQELNKFEAEHLELIQNIMISALSDQELRNWLAVHFQLRSLISQLAYKTEQSESLKKKAHELDSGTISISINNLRNVDYMVRRRIRFLKSLVGNKTSFDMNINATHITTAITVASSFFIITGYLYTKYFLQGFGIDVSNYFSLSDYLAASIEKIQYIAFSVIVGVGGVIVGSLKGPQKFTIRHAYLQSKFRYIYYSLIIFSLLMCLIVYLKEPQQFDYTVFGLPIFLILFWNIPFICRSMFNQSRIAEFILFFFLYYSFHLFNSVGTTIHKYKYSKLEKLKQYTIVLDDKNKIKTDHMVILASNTRFYFLYDVKNKQTYIVPERSVNRIESIR